MNVGFTPLQELFRAAVLKMLKKEGKVDGSFIRRFDGMSFYSQSSKADFYH